MTMDVVIQLISTVAFPIVMCILEAWYIKYQTDSHAQETEKFRASLDANTQILNKLYERLNEDSKKEG